MMGTRYSFSSAEERAMEIWNNPACSKSAVARDAFDAADLTYRVRPYLDQPPTVVELRGVLARLGAAPWEVCRLGEPIAAELGLADWPRDPDSEGRWIAAMVAHPQLIQRPIVLLDDGTAVIARTPESVAEVVQRAAGRVNP